VQRLYKLCAEWKEAEDSLRKKWKKIEEFDARRSELECIYSALQRANMVSVQSCGFLCQLLLLAILVCIDGIQYVSVMIFFLKEFRMIFN
jgi:hypothetical protein